MPETTPRDGDCSDVFAAFIDLFRDYRSGATLPQEGNERLSELLTELETCPENLRRSWQENELDWWLHYFVPPDTPPLPRAFATQPESPSCDETLTALREAIAYKGKASELSIRQRSFFDEWTTALTSCEQRVAVSMRQNEILPFLNE